MQVQGEANARNLPQLPSTLVFETRFFTEHKFANLARLAGQQTPRSTCFHHTELGLQEHTVQLVAHVDSGDLHSGPGRLHGRYFTI
ncbi:hypothetical protein I79_022969 [Cricetulus griseus]|uniref:Uncharacterized protein n=1 Tax=Cricetulus griseus TaxID=10029 RepID=G3IGP7_CRIGR|nr:hypothetical protein I79_022969 [Cricetulus griseus]